MKKLEVEERIVDLIQDSGYWDDFVNCAEPGPYGVNDFEAYVNNISVNLSKKTFKADVKVSADFIMGSSKDGFNQKYSKTHVIEGEFDFDDYGNVKINFPTPHCDLF